MKIIFDSEQERYDFIQNMCNEGTCPNALNIGTQESDADGYYNSELDCRACIENRIDEISEVEGT